MTAAVGLDLAQRCGLRGGNVAGSDAVALDVVSAVLGSDVLGQHLQAALCCCISRNGLTAQLAHHGADVDDLAAALCDHIGDDGLCHDEGSVQIDVDDLTELGSAHLGHGDALDDTGVVDQNVDVADFLGDLCHHSIDGVLVGDVADVAVSLDACLCIGSQTLVHQLLLDIIEHDGSAVGCHSLCNCHADAVGCAGDQRHLAGQVKRFGSALCHNKVLLSKIVFYTAQIAAVLLCKARRIRPCRSALLLVYQSSILCRKCQGTFL